MRSARVAAAAGQDTFFLVFDRGDDVLAELTGFAREHRLAGARFAGIGGFSSATLAYFDPETLRYEPIPVGGQVEVASFAGDIGVADGEPVVHAHAVLGTRDGSAVAGHVLGGIVWPTLELTLSAWDVPLARKPDARTGLKLIELEGSGS
jgi:uncharacterized protein